MFEKKLPYSGRWDQNFNTTSKKVNFFLILRKFNNEFTILISLIIFLKSFNLEENAKVELLCGIIKISLEKLTKPITKNLELIN